MRGDEEPCVKLSTPRTSIAYTSGAARPPSTLRAAEKTARGVPLRGLRFLSTKRKCPGRTAAGALYGGSLVYQQRQLAASRVNGNLLVQCASAACDRMLGQGGALPSLPQSTAEKAARPLARSFLFRCIPFDLPRGAFGQQLALSPHLAHSR